MIKEVVVKAYNFAKEKHEGQFRRFSNLPYFTHCKAVARFVEELTHDEILVATALLHDTIEDTDTTFEEIVSVFGDDIANLVFELTSVKEDMKKYSSKAEYLANKIQNMTSDAFLIKLCDRLHNVQFLEEDCSQDEKQRKFVEKYYYETRYILKNVKHFVWNKATILTIERIEKVLDFVQIANNFS